MCKPICFVGVCVVFSLAGVLRAEVEELPIQKRWSGSYCGVSTAGQRVVRDADAWRDLWGEVNRTRRPAPSPPEVDFSKQTAVAVFMGQRNSGGYSIRVASVRDTGREGLPSGSSEPPLPLVRPSPWH